MAVCIKNKLCREIFRKIKISLFFAIIMMMPTFTYASSATAQNLLANGNPSTNLYGWKSVDNYTRAVSQDVDIRNYVGKELTLSADAQELEMLKTDKLVLLLEFFDSNGNLIDKRATVDSKNSAWHKIQVTRIVPSNAVHGRVTLYVKYHSEKIVGSFFDNVVLTASETVTTTPNMPSKNSDATSSNSNPPKN